MPLQCINELLGLPELQLDNVLCHNATEVHLEALPVAHKRLCQSAAPNNRCCEMAEMSRARAGTAFNEGY